MLVWSCSYSRVLTVYESVNVHTEINNYIFLGTVESADGRVANYHDDIIIPHPKTIELPHNKFSEVAHSFAVRSVPWDARGYF